MHPVQNLNQGQTTHECVTLSLIFILKGEQLLYKRCETQKEALELRNEYARKYNLKEQEWVGEI